MGRNTYTGPGLNNWDTSLFKNFSLAEKVRLQMRLESFNTFNHAQWSTPNYQLSSPSFGQVTGTRVPGRINQVGLKFLF
jgi:hypothetical protein